MYLQILCVEFPIWLNKWIFIHPKRKKQGQKPIRWNPWTERPPKLKEKELPIAIKWGTDKALANWWPEDFAWTESTCFLLIKLLITPPPPHELPFPFPPSCESPNRPISETKHQQLVLLIFFFFLIYIQQQQQQRQQKIWIWIWMIVLSDYRFFLHTKQRVSI